MTADALEPDWLLDSRGRGCSLRDVRGRPAVIACSATMRLGGGPVYHATGKRIRDLPITLDKLL